MKKDIHPQYYPKAKVTCACGNTFTLGSTQPSLQVEVCSNCHPFYTGKDKMVDKMGQVQKFKARLAQKSAASSASRRTRRNAKLLAAKQIKGNVRITAKPVRPASAKASVSKQAQGKKS